MHVFLKSRRETTIDQFCFREGLKPKHDMKHERIEIKFYNLDTLEKQIDVNFIDLDSELVDLNHKVESLIFCHF